MDEFYSLKFSKIYFNNAMSSPVKLCVLQFADAHVLLLDSVANFINYENDNDELTIIG